MELIQRTICESQTDYDGLLNNMKIVKNTLKIDDDSNIIMSTGPMILDKMFRISTSSPSTEWGFWRDEDGDRPPNDVENYELTADMSCFKDIYIYYYDKHFCVKSEPYYVVGDECLNEAYSIIKTGTISPLTEIPPESPFSLVADTFAHYLATIIGEHIDDVLKVMDTFCYLIKKYISVSRVYKKTAITIDSFEL